VVVQSGSFPLVHFYKEFICTDWLSQPGGQVGSRRRSPYPRCTRWGWDLRRACESPLLPKINDCCYRYFICSVV